MAGHKGNSRWPSRQVRLRAVASAPGWPKEGPRPKSPVAVVVHPEQCTYVATPARRVTLRTARTGAAAAPRASVFFRIVLCAYLRVRQFPAATLGCFLSRGTVALCPLRRSTCRTRHGLLSSAPTAQHVVDASRKEQFSVQSRARTRKRGASVSRVSIFRAAHLRRSTCSQRHPRGHCMLFN